MTPEELATRILAGDVRAVARGCRWADDGAPEARALLAALYARGRGAWLLGVTGPPGAGKSTLTDRILARLRARGERVGVVAVDPTSPFSGGAILGDRIRMQRHFEDPEVFIRSVATRGALGGLSRTAADVAVVLAAWGAGVVIIETVGVGQDELEVSLTADTTLVALVPGLGDDVQALKAGILESADVFTVNKADREGAEAAVRDLESMVSLGESLLVDAAHRSPSGGGHGARFRASVSEPHAGNWRPRIVSTVASTGQGIDELMSALDAHRAHLATHEAGKREERERARLVTRLRDELTTLALGELEPRLSAAASRLAAGQSDPYSECEALLREFRHGSPP
jgi:LAO/AO transport system kinase